jgi:hypothetical protein
MVSNVEELKIVYSRFEIFQWWLLLLVLLMSVPRSLGFHFEWLSKHPKWFNKYVRKVNDVDLISFIEFQIGDDQLDQEGVLLGFINKQFHVVINDSNNDLYNFFYLGLLSGFIHML